MKALEAMKGRKDNGEGNQSTPKVGPGSGAERKPAALEAEAAGGDRDSAAGPGDLGNEVQSGESGVESGAEEIEVAFDPAAEDEGEDAVTDQGDEDEAEALSDEDLAALDEKARKQMTDLHKANAKIRKRAQEAEQKAKELEEKLAGIEKAEQERAAQVPEAVARQSGNSLWQVKDSAVLDAFEQDARAVIDKLSRLGDPDRYPDEEAEYQSRVDGKTYTIDAKFASWAVGTLEDVRERREELKAATVSEGKGASIAKRMEKAPEYAEALKQISGAKLATQWPEVRAEAAIGRMVTSGKYKLVKISTGQAAAATSAAKGAGTSSPTPAKRTPPREPRGTMPRGAPEEAGGVPGLSAIQGRAMKSGKPDDIKELLKAKRAAALQGA